MPRKTSAIRATAPRPRAEGIARQQQREQRRKRLARKAATKAGR